MGRPPRTIGDDLIYHALNRGNNGQRVFDDDDDLGAFLQTMGQTQTRYPFRLYGYCLMPNHFHLLLKPEPGVSISRVLQSITVAHTWRHHKRHQSLGHVWQGRFKSPVIQDDEHFWTVLRYIEANPVRAKLVEDPSAYRWSSYCAHALGKVEPLLTELPGWNDLGSTEKQRRTRWRAKVVGEIVEDELNAVRASARLGRPFGSPAWTEATARRLGIPLGDRPRGRPKKTN
ncbi:MAG: transposase [Isosphaeraceae bacterium]